MVQKRKRSEVDTPCDSLQSMMELAIQPLSQNDKAVFQNENGSFLRYNQWKGLKINASGEIIAIIWHNLFKEKGSLSFTYIPESVETIAASNCFLSGPINFKDFPDGLKWLDLSSNELSGEVNFDHLPRRIERLYLNGNKFEKLIELPKNLPQSLHSTRLPTVKPLDKQVECLWLKKDGKCITLDEKYLLPQQILMEQVVAQLSPRDKAIFQDPEGKFLPLVQWKGLHLDSDGIVVKIKWYDLFEENALLAFKWLPPALEYFQASHCRLLGKVSLKQFPLGLKYLDLSNNVLTGSIDLNTLPKEMEVAILRNNSFSCCLDMKNLPQRLGVLHLSQNMFYGPLDLRNLPRSLRSFSLKNNRFNKGIIIGDIPEEILSVNMLSLSGNMIREVELLKSCAVEGATIVRSSREVILKNGKGLNIAQIHSNPCLAWPPW